MSATLGARRTAGQGGSIVSADGAELAYLQGLPDARHANEQNEWAMYSPALGCWLVSDVTYDEIERMLGSSDASLLHPSDHF